MQKVEEEEDVAPSAPSVARKLFDWIGAHKVADRGQQERQRALQRFVLALIGMAGTWLGSEVSGIAPVPVQDPAFLACVLYGVCGLAFWRYLQVKPAGGVAAQYAFMVADPVLIAVLAAARPGSMGWFSVILLANAARTGLRYGLRSLYVVWGAASVMSALMWGWQFAAGQAADHVQIFLVTFAGLAVGVPMFVQVIKTQTMQAQYNERKLRLDVVSSQVERQMEFLSMVSHELRTPLQSILSSIELMEMNLGEDVDEREIARLGLNAKAISTQLNDIITLARGELGIFSFRPQEVSVASAVLEAVEAVRPFAKMKSLDLQLSLPEHDVRICMDSVRLIQIVVNLLSNAVKYTHKGFVRVEVLELPNDRSTVSIRILDSGVGVPKEDADRIFSPYDRGAATSYPVSSAGVGLAVVKMFVDFVGGRIDVDSAPGRGSSFTVSLPAVSLHKVDDGPRVLAVGANLASDPIVVDALQKIGLPVDYAEADGYAIVLLSARSYSVLLFDARSPQETEQGVRRMIKASSDYMKHGVTRVFVSHKSLWKSDAVDERILIQEPISISRLLESIGNVAV